MPITEVEGRRLKLSHLDRVLWPQTGTTKAELLEYYATVAGVLLPHTRGRLASFVRTPDGVDGQRFFQKRPPAGTPDWVTTTERVRSGGELMEQVEVNDLATLVWAGNLSCVEIHTPQWCAADPDTADRLVLDLDPGPGRTAVDCCRVALDLRERLAADGIACWAKTSGSKGLHLLAALRGATPDGARAYARTIARELEATRPDRVVSRMAKADRTGRVFIDWSQNSASKTTAVPYTVRARARPTVSAPLTWDEVAAVDAPEQLGFAIGDMPARLAGTGDVLAALLDPGSAAALPG
ncbi:bifunctional non-homologous end joining protein LigD [Actinacidiphila yanglinensis]|uniref:Bifunctional non-homologous end joining protein LigD n=1 Tax=Actinacidiphila yanglinensis TaxID=310779 RepID=A0A1H6E7S6_9ACTN|nr:non-homologous end-joining DNA ligase [Actinacidiphila yanglinensis]SEG93303.1 bifunctional non-homologous end joining protein LigD [Actinacidiphila yanglinensis]